MTPIVSGCHDSLRAQQASTSAKGLNAPECWQARPQKRDLIRARASVQPSPRFALDWTLATDALPQTRTNEKRRDSQWHDGD